MDLKDCTIRYIGNRQGYLRNHTWELDRTVELNRTLGEGTQVGHAAHKDVYELTYPDGSVLYAYVGNFHVLIGPKESFLQDRR